MDITQEIIFQRKLKNEELFLLLLSAITLLVFAYFYFKIKCEYLSADQCITAHKEDCGSPIVETINDCEKFVKETEDCFCSKCRLCTTYEGRHHCDLTHEERIKMCINQFNGETTTTIPK